MSKRERQRDGSSSSPMGYYSNSYVGNVNASASGGATHTSSHHSYSHSYSGYSGGGGDPEIANKKRKMQFGKSANIHIPQTNHSSSSNHYNNNSSSHNNNRGRNTNTSHNHKKPKTSNPDTKMEELFRRLDPLVPKEAQRMKTRSKMIEKGKNTVGYDEYIRRVPKSSRRLCVEHPRTPDHHLDLPNRRWLGLVKTWRKTLHQYDPKDLSSDLFTDPAQPSNNNNITTNTIDTSTPTQKKSVMKMKMKLKLKPKTTVREEQIAKATTQGLQVDFASPVGVAHAHDNNEHDDTQNNLNTNEKHHALGENDPHESLNSNNHGHMLGNCNYNYYHNDDDATAFVDCTNNQGDDEIDKWEKDHGNQNTPGGEEDDLIDFDDDSDDDLL